MTEEAKKMGISEGFDKNFEYSGLKAFQIDSEETSSKIFRNVQIPEHHLPKQFPHYISLMNSSFKFRHPIIIHEKYTKVLPSKDCEILICGGDYPIYLLQSDEQMINFFFIEVEENFNMESIDSILHVYIT